jgi:hypothetical protein
MGLFIGENRGGSRAWIDQDYLAEEASGFCIIAEQYLLFAAKSDTHLSL